MYSTSADFLMKQIIIFYLLGTASSSQHRAASRQINQYSGGVNNGRSPAEDKQQTNSAANGLVVAGMSHFFAAKPSPYNPYLQ